MEKGVLKKIVEHTDKRIAVIGDIMVDQYTYGSVLRISPEAPVPILKKTDEKFILGGAANVANNLVHLGADVRLIGQLGDDPEKDIVLSLLKAAGINSDGIIVSDAKPTTVKHRFIAGKSNQMLRMDREDAGALPEDVQAQLVKHTLDILSDIDVLVCSDYAKGLLTQTVVEQIVAACKQADVKVLVDTKPSNKELYKHVDLVTPNMKEAVEMVGDLPVEEVGAKLVELFSSNVFLTRGADGISVFTTAGETANFSTKINAVTDVTGAGDTVVAMAAIALAADCTMLEAAFLADLAGGIVVQKPGTSTLTVAELAAGLGDADAIADVEIVPKLWGYEKWLENNEKYCCKILSINKGFQCSLHYHKNKDEMFLCTKGNVKVELDDEIIFMKPGNFVRVEPGQKHRFTGLEDSELIEVSTFHEDSDSYRIEMSQKVE